MAVKIKYEQRYLDDELRTHIGELLDKLANVPSDDEAEEDKENVETEENGGDDDDDETDSTSEDDEGSAPKDKLKGNKNKLAQADSKAIKSNHNHNDEPMEFT